MIPVPAGQGQSGIPPLKLGQVSISGLADFYSTLNFDHPVSRVNLLYNFNIRADSAALNMIEMSLDANTNPLGFHVDAGFGDAYKLVTADEPRSLLRNVMQAYVTYRPAGSGSIEFDFGNFGTSAGAESVETLSGWNYSRSLLFTWAQPNYHFGLRTSAPMGKHVRVGLQIVNGWNNFVSHSYAKTIGLTATANWRRLNWYQDYYFGPELPDGTWRHLYDTTLVAILSSRAQASLNFDYAWQRSGHDTRNWAGTALAASFQLKPGIALNPRVEWFNDAEGLRTGVTQQVTEATITADWKVARSVVVRAEYRRDWSGRPFFERATDPDSSKTQSVVLLGMIVYFGSVAQE